MPGSPFKRNGNVAAVIFSCFFRTFLRQCRHKIHSLFNIRLARSHWEVENRLHHVKDRSLGEDADRTHAGATVMGRLRSLAVGSGE